MIRRATIFTVVGLLSVFQWTCNLGVEPASKPDFVGMIMLAPGDSTNLVLTRLMALENDEIQSYQISGISDTLVATVRHLSGDSIQVIAGESGVSELVLTASGLVNQYDVEIRISVSDAHQNGSLNRINLGDTLAINLSEYGVLNPEAVDSINLSFSTEGYCGNAGITNGVLYLSAEKPGSTSVILEVWEAGIRRTIEIEIEVFIRRMVFAELFTNAGCIPCAPANTLINEIKAASSIQELAVLRYHVSWPSPNDPMYGYNRSESTARVIYYGISQAPTLVIDGVFAPSSTDLWSTQIDQARATDAALTINILNITDLGADSVMIDYQVDSYSDADLTNLRFMSAVAEDSVEFLGDNGEDLHMQVMRDYHYVHEPNLSANGRYTGQSRLKWQAVSAERSRYTVIVFAQDDGNKKILQATQKSLN